MTTFVTDQFTLNMLTKSEHLTVERITETDARNKVEFDGQGASLTARTRDLLEASLGIPIPGDEGYIFPDFANDRILVGQRTTDGRGHWVIGWWLIHS